MKKLGLIILVLLQGIFSFADEINYEEFLVQANSLYQENKFDEAIDKYEQIHESGLESAALYFNLGNSYYKVREYPKAVLNYERAKLLAPNDADIQLNLEIAQLHVIDQIKALPELYFKKIWRQLIQSNSSDAWAVISITLFFLFLALLSFYLYSRSASIKRLTFILSLFMLIVSAFSFHFSAKQKDRLLNRNTAIVMTPSVSVKSSPAESGTDLFLLHEGVKVTITDNLTGWVEIKIADGRLGWVKVDTIEKI